MPLESRWFTVAAMPGVEDGVDEDPVGVAEDEARQKLPMARRDKIGECMFGIVGG